MPRGRQGQVIQQSEVETGGIQKGSMLARDNRARDSGNFSGGGHRLRKTHEL